MRRCSLGTLLVVQRLRQTRVQRWGTNIPHAMRRDEDDVGGGGKMLIIANHQRNAGQNHNGIPLTPVRIVIVKRNTNSKRW